MLTKKQKNNILCVIMAAILAVSAVGCSFVNVKEKETEGTETKEPEVMETKEVETEEPKETDDPVETEEPVETGDVTSHEFYDDMVRFYHEAEQVYALFTEYPGRRVYAEGLITVGPYKYEAANIEGVTSLAELRALCEQYFSDSLTKKLMNKTVGDAPLYIEQDGKLYRFGAYVGQYGGEPYNYRMKLESRKDEKYGTVTVCADWQEGGREVSEEISCSYTIQKDGTIRFTRFRLMAEALVKAWEWNSFPTYSLPIPEMTVEVGASHPGVENVLFRMGNNCVLFYHEMAYFSIGDYESTKYTLNLPEGYENGKLLHVFEDEYTGAIHFIAEARDTEKNETAYLDYELRAYGEDTCFDIVSLIELSEEQRDILRMELNRRTEDVFPCYDVYHCNQSVSIGTAILTVPTAFIHYDVIDWEVIYCEDDCDPTDLLRRAYKGYTPEYLIEQYEEYTVEDGWNYATRRYIDETPQSMIDSTNDYAGSIVPAPTIETVYLLTLGENLYAYVYIGRTGTTNVSSDEIEYVNEVIKNTRFLFIPTEKEISSPETKEDYYDNGAIYRLEVMPTVRTKVDALPSSEQVIVEESYYNDELYVFDEGMTFYLHNGKGVYYKNELQLPEGYSNGKIVGSSTTEGFADIVLFVNAEKDGSLTEIYYSINCARIYPVLDRVWVLVSSAQS